MSRFIIGLPTGDMIDVSDEEFFYLRDIGLIHYVSTYLGNVVNDFCFYEINRDSINYNLEISRKKGIDSIINRQRFSW